MLLMAVQGPREPGDSRTSVDPMRKHLFILMCALSLVHPPRDDARGSQW